MESLSFVIACKRFFGLAPGQTLQGFAAEVKALTPEDRAELTPALESALSVKVNG